MSEVAVRAGASIARLSRWAQPGGGQSNENLRTPSPRLAADPVPELIRLGRRTRRRSLSALALAALRSTFCCLARGRDIAAAAGTMGFWTKFVDLVSRLALPSLLLTVVRLARPDAGRGRSGPG